MAQYAFRTIVAIIGFILFVVVLPLLFGVLGIDLAANAMQLIKICAAVIALAYIVWGPPLYA